MGIGETIVSTAWVLIPLSIFAIPLTAVIGKVIVQPIAAAITRLADAERGVSTTVVTNQRAADLDARLTRIEQQLARLADVEARRQLEASAAANQPALAGGSATPLLRS